MKFSPTKVVNKFGQNRLGSFCCANFCFFKIKTLRVFIALLSLPFLILSLCSVSLAADYQSHMVDGNDLIINTSENRIVLRAFGDSAFEVLYETSQGNQLPSFAISEKAQSTSLEIANNPDFLSVNAGNINAVVSKSPFQISYYQGGKLLVAEEVGLFQQETTRGFRFKLQNDEKLLGGGERVVGMDRRGQRFPLYNRASYGYTTQSNQMYFGLSAVMSSEHYTLIFDNSASGYMDLGFTQQDIMQFESMGGRTAYIVVAGETYPKLIENTVRLTGRQPLPPRWALGNFASRFGYHTEQETRDTVQTFIDEGFPLDAVVLDLYWFGKEVKGMMGNLDWDKAAFPTPKKMIADFSDQGVKTILITEPFILSSSKRWQEALDNNVLALGLDNQVKQYDFFFGNTGLIDVFYEPASEWFSGIYTNLYKQGVAGWWGDLGEPEVHPSDLLHKFNGMTVTADEIHNAYGHMWAKRVFDNQLTIAPKQRPFVMMRSGFVGSQRYGMIPWTGDVSRSWDGLKPQVELALQMGVLGLAYTHSDLGGFAGGEQFDQELYIRWLEYGVFQPVFRPHGQEEIAPEPIFHDKQTKDILREHIKLRYAMLPYNYSLVYENSLTGMPLMRPVFFEDESNTTLIDIKDSYFWGKALLVKPITEPNLSEISVDLPAGRWFDFWSDEDYDGNQTITLKTELDRIPVMVKAGSFLPMVQPVQSTDDYTTEQLDLHYYSDTSITRAQAKMYDDDGKSPNAISLGEYETLSFSATQQDKQLQISLNRQGKYKGMPRKRDMRLIIHNWLKAPLQAQKAIKTLLPDVGLNEENVTSSAVLPVSGNEALKPTMNEDFTVVTETPLETVKSEIPGVAPKQTDDAAITTPALVPVEENVIAREITTDSSELSSTTMTPTTNETVSVPPETSLANSNGVVPEQTVKPAPSVTVVPEKNNAKPAPMLASLPLVVDLAELDKSKAAMYWEESTSTLYLKFSWQHDIQVTIKQ
jgi:oligosaccharide 4-alpha-D-glucosyltransferase